MLELELKQIIAFFISGFLGSLFMTLFIAMNEEKLGLPVKYKFKSRRDILKAFFLIYTGCVNGMLGGLCAIAIDGNLFNAIIAGMFSQLILLLMVKWILTKKFRLALNEILGGIFDIVLKPFGLKIEKKSNDEKNKNIGIQIVYIIVSFIAIVLTILASVYTNSLLSIFLITNTIFCFALSISYKYLHNTLLFVAFSIMGFIEMRYTLLRMAYDNAGLFSEVHDAVRNGVINILNHYEVSLVFYILQAIFFLLLFKFILNSNKKDKFI